MSEAISSRADLEIERFNPRLKPLSPVSAATPSAIAPITNRNLFHAGRVSRQAIRISKFISPMPLCRTIRSFLDDSAVTQMNDPVGKPAERRIVRHDHQRRSVAAV